MPKLLFYLEKKLAAVVLRLLRRTLKFQVKNQAASDGIICIYAFWHRNLMYCTLQRMGDKVAVIISASKDGELIAGPVSELGFIPVRGSSSRQGSVALKAMLRYAKTNSLAITPDGPKGPVGTIHPGLFQLAIMAKIPIVPIACHADREWVFNSWDRFRFPKPFAKVWIHYSDPIWLKEKDEIDSVEAQIRDFLQNADEELRKN